MAAFDSSSAGSSDKLPKRSNNIYRLQIKSNGIPFSKKKEPFQLFQLPEEILYKILKDYVPVTDKAGVLRQVPQFSKFLAIDSLWFPSTHKLFQLASFIRPGWYIDLKHLNDRYYFTVDYFNLTFSVHVFNTNELVTKICENYHEDLIPFSLMQILLVKHKEFDIVPIEENDVLFYQYQSRSFQFVSIWVMTGKNTVRWSKDDVNHPLENNECFLTTETDRLLLTFLEDSTIRLQCLEHQHPLHNSLPSPTACSCPQKEECVLLHYSFQVCREKDPTKNICWIDADKKVSLCNVCEYNSKAIHVKHQIVFRNVHRSDSSIVCKKYFSCKKTEFESRNWLQCQERIYSPSFESNFKRYIQL